MTRIFSLGTDRSAGDAPVRPFDGPAIALHWISAVAIVVLWLIGQTVEFLPRGPLRLGIWSMHVIVGFALTLIIAMRVFWRAKHPPREARDPGLMGAVASVTHYALYLLMIAVLALGVTNAFLRGYNLFGVWSLPRMTQDKALVHLVSDWHELAANALVAVASLHVAAALFHQFVLRDGVLRSMIPNVGRT